MIFQNHFEELKRKNVIYWEGDGKNLYGDLEHAKNVYGVH